MMYGFGGFGGFGALDIPLMMIRLGTISLVLPILELSIMLRPPLGNRYTVTVVCPLPMFCAQTFSIDLTQVRYGGMVFMEQQRK